MRKKAWKWGQRKCEAAARRLLPRWSELVFSGALGVNRGLHISGRGGGFFFNGSENGHMTAQIKSDVYSPYKLQTF